MSSVHHLFARTIPLLLALATTAAAAEGTPPELAALQREHDRRKADALRPVMNWYEGELQRLERSFTTRGNLDAALAVRAERDSVRVGGGDPSIFRSRIADSTWRWNGASPTEIKFRADGVLEAQDWQRSGYDIRWEVTAPLTVTYKVIKGPADVGREIKLTFTPDLKSFSGVNADGKPIQPSPRLR